MKYIGSVLGIAVLLCMGAGVLHAAPYLRFPLREAVRESDFEVAHAYDFGTETSPVRPGFMRVSASTVKTPGRDYGWSASEGVETYAVREHGKPSSFGVEVFFNPVQELALNECTEDSCWGRGEAVFEVAVPPGDYLVYYLGGVPYRGGFPGPPVLSFEATLNDRSDTVCIPFHTMFDNRRYRVRIGESGLRVRFAARTAWVVDALVVVPAARVEQAEATVLAPLEQDTYLLPPYARERGQRFLERIPPQLGRPIPSLGDPWRTLGFVLFSHDWSDPVMPDSVPSAEAIGQSVDLFGTPGEWEPAMLAVRALEDDIEITSVACSPLTRADGRRIPAETIRVHRVQYCWLAEGSGRGYSNGGTVRARLAPYLLEPVEPVTVQAGANQPYWFNVFIPAGAAPGTYRGTVTVRTGKGQDVDVPMRLRVLPFALETPSWMTYGVYWSPVWNWLKRNHRDESVRAIAAEREQQELDDFREHLVQSFTYGYFTGWDVNAEAETVTPHSPDFPGMAEAVSLWRRAGCTGPIVGTPVKTLYWRISRDLMKEARPEGLAYRQQWHRRDTEVPERALRLIEKGTRLVQRHIEANDYPEFLYYILDESDPRLLRKLYSAVRRVPGTRTYTTSANQAADIGPWTSVNCSVGSFLKRGDWEGEVRERAERGEFEPWLYPNGCVMGFDGTPARSRYIYGFNAWKMGLRGVYPWMYSTNNTKGNPFNDFDRDYPDTGFVMPGPDGLILTVRWDGAREGIDDMRYVATLAALLREAREADGDGLGQHAQRIAAELDRVKRDGVPDAFYMSDEAEAWCRQSAQAYRWFVASLIMELQDAMGGAGP